MPLPPWMSIASFTHWRARSVMWYLAIAEITEGFSPVHEHHPALARVVLAADDPVDRHEDVLAPVRPVLEHAVQRQVAPADVHSGRAGRHQGAGNSKIDLLR